MKGEGVAEVRGEGAGEGEEDLRGDRGEDVLMWAEGGDVGVAELEGEGEEVE